MPYYLLLYSHFIFHKLRHTFTFRKYIFKKNTDNTSHNTYSKHIYLTTPEDVSYSATINPTKMSLVNRNNTTWRNKIIYIK